MSTGKKRRAGLGRLLGRGGIELGLKASGSPDEWRRTLGKGRVCLGNHQHSTIAQVQVERERETETQRQREIIKGRLK